MLLLASPHASGEQSQCGRIAVVAQSGRAYNSYRDEAWMQTRTNRVAV